MKSSPCPGCHVGADDECEAGCPATTLVLIGWTPEQAEDILAHRIPRHVEDGLNVGYDSTPLPEQPANGVRLADVLADAFEVGL